MSGSYDQTGRRRPTEFGNPPEYAYRDDAVTAPPRQGSRFEPDYPDPDHGGYGAADDLEDPDFEITAPARSRKGLKAFRRENIVPAGSVTGNSLLMVISIMCFLACLTGGAVWMMYQSSEAWLRDVASEVTVQVETTGRDSEETSRRVEGVVRFLETQPGIANATSLGLSASSDLLEPWLGSSEALKSLPVPRMIAVELDRSAPPDFDEVRAQLQARFPEATLDDHRQWQQQIKTVTRSFALGGIFILVLVALATAAIIVSATRSAMTSNRDIVEVLHFVGATDGFIAREFERHFLRLGIKAGLVGAASAMLIFLLLPWFMILVGGGTVSQIELQRLVGGGSLDFAGYVLLGIIVVIVAGLCMVTSRFGVYQILKSRP